VRVAHQSQTFHKRPFLLLPLVNLAPNGDKRPESRFLSGGAAHGARRVPKSKIWRTVPTGLTKIQEAGRARGREVGQSAINFSRQNSEMCRVSSVTTELNRCQK
jgi:hypothetical protein